MLFYEIFICLYLTVENLWEGITREGRVPCAQESLPSWPHLQPSPEPLWTYCTKQKELNNKIIELFGLEGPFKGQLVQPQMQDITNHLWCWVSGWIQCPQRCFPNLMILIYILPGRERQWTTPKTLESPKPELFPSPVDKNHLNLLSHCHKLSKYKWTTLNETLLLIHRNAVLGAPQSSFFL